MLLGVFVLFPLAVKPKVVEAATVALVRQLLRYSACFANASSSRRW
jgi:hypothetical protein